MSSKQNIIAMYEDLQPTDKYIAVDRYLRRLSKSISVKFNPPVEGVGSVSSLTDLFRSGNGWKSGKHGYFWEEREKYWKSTGALWLGNTGIFKDWIYNSIPVFPERFEEAINYATQQRATSTRDPEFKSIGRNKMINVQQSLNMYENMRDIDKYKTIEHYLIRLGKSINVEFNPPEKDLGSIEALASLFRKGRGWQASKGGFSWKDREKCWDEPDTLWLGSNYINKNKGRYHNLIPIFPKWFREAIDYTLRQKYTNRMTATNKSILKTRKEQKMKQVINEVLDTNKEAAHIATKLSAGSVANSFFLNKLFGKFPWYARLFGKKKELTSNPLAKLVTANVAKVLATNFAADNDKLNYVADAMVQDSLVTLTRDSDVLEKLTQELENLVDIPDFGKGGKND